jgi:hypothetical protein
MMGNGLVFQAVAQFGGDFPAFAIPGYGQFDVRPGLGTDDDLGELGGGFDRHIIHFGNHISPGQTGFIRRAVLDHFCHLRPWWLLDGNPQPTVGPDW